MTRGGVEKCSEGVQRRSYGRSAHAIAPEKTFRMRRAAAGSTHRNLA